MATLSLIFNISELLIGLALKMPWQGPVIHTMLSSHFAVDGCAVDSLICKSGSFCSCKINFDW
jgi:hypothetical protein